MIHLLFFLISLTTSFNSSASEITPGSEVQSLLAEYKNLPKDEHQLFDQIANEIIIESTPLLNKLFTGSPPDVVQAFIYNLTTQQSPESLANLATLLERNSITSIRFLSILTETVRSKPYLLNKIQARMKYLEQHLKNTKTPMATMGARILNSSLFVMGCAGFLYSYESAFWQPEYRHLLASQFGFVKSFFAFMLTLNIYAEMKAISLGIKDFIHRKLKKNRTQVYLGELSALIDELRKQPKMQIELAQHYYFTSGQAEIDAKKVMPLLIESFKSQQDKFLDLGIQQFLESKNFANIFNRLKSRINKRQLLELQKLLETDMQYKDKNFLTENWVLFNEFKKFENEVAIEFKKYIHISEKSGTEKIQAYADLLQALSDYQQQQDLRRVILTHPSAWTQLSWTTASIGVALIGLSASIGKEATPMDIILPEMIVRTFRDNPSAIFWIAGLSTLPSLSNFYFNFMPTLINIKNEWKNTEINRRAYAALEYMKNLYLRENIDNLDPQLTVKSHGTYYTADEFVANVIGQKKKSYKSYINSGLIPNYCSNVYLH